jgi:hypothetical protein
VILAARLGFLLLAAAAVALALVVGHRDGAASAHPLALYSCPMHPEVAARGPGRCPICAMALEEMAAGRQEGGDDEPGGLHADREARAVAGAGPHTEAKQDPGAGQGADVQSGPGDRGEMPATRGLSQAARFLTYGATPVHRRVLGAAAPESPAWLEGGGDVSAVLFEDELGTLGPHEPATFVAARAPGVAFPAHRTDEPPQRWHGSTWRVRFRLDGPAPALRVGASGWLARAASRAPALVVLSSAVLQAASGPYVLGLAADGRTFHRLPITTGKVVSGYTSVVGGAGERELVLGLNTFSLDAEGRLQAERRAAGALGGHDGARMRP